MKVLVGTLFNQSMLHSNFHRSMMDVYQQSIVNKNEVARQIMSQIPNFSAANPEHKQTFDLNMNHHTFDIGEYSLGGESLLARGRNHIAQVALTGGWDKLLFVDSDEGFTWADFTTLATAPYPVAAGLVPLKAYPIPGTFETSLNFLPFQEDEIFFDDSLRTLKSTLRMARAKKSPWIEVAYTGTGFLCVDVAVFAKLAETTPEYIYPNPNTQQPEVHWAFFDGGPMHDQYFSEDWSFASKCRDSGFKVMVNVNVRASHVGPHQFVAG